MLESKPQKKIGPVVVPTSYTSLPVAIPDDFLAPLTDPSVITTAKIDFTKILPEYEKYYAVVLDNVLSQQECDELIHMAEMSAGAHQDGVDVPGNGWVPAMINAGIGQEFMAQEYRNSDRIIWNDKVVAKRLWGRILQGQGIREDLMVLKGKTSVVTEQGLNERLRFLKYGAGQFFKEHTDGTYRTPDGKQKSFYTIHLYLNDSAQALGIPEPPADAEQAAGNENIKDELLRGGSTPFLSRDLQRRIDVDPKAGRVLIFQHRGLLHSGDYVTSGIKYTMRSDLMYDLADGED